MSYEDDEMIEEIWIDQLVGIALIVLCMAATVALLTTRVELETPAPTPAPATEREYPVRKCEHLYNVGRHKEWAACMRVTYI